MSVASPASPFAALLRRSKFAQYDPRIGQVYATYGGDAARGHWGLKRPLPLRKRHAHITVKSVDSPEQQTEWKHAEQQARWVKMYDEVGLPPDAKEEKSWYHKRGPDASWRWDIDSEFATRDTKSVPSGKLEEQTRGPRLPPNVDPEVARAAVEEGIFADSMTTPNINAMTEKEFEAYLRKLRKLRPQFLEYIKKRTAASSPIDREPARIESFWNVAALQTGTMQSGIHNHFLSYLQYKKHTDAGSRAIEQQPHKFAGLSYSHHNALQGRFYAPPKPGRMLIKKSSTERGGNAEDIHVSFAGMSAQLPNAFRSDKGALNWRKLAVSGEFGSEDGIADMRFVDVTLLDAPEVVGEVPEDLERTSFTSTVQVVTERNCGVSLSNPHRPGSREYVSHVEARHKNQKPTTFFSTKPKNIVYEEPKLPVSQGHLIGTLAGMVNNPDA